MGIITLAFLVLVAGCQTSAQRTAFTSLADTVKTIDSAMVPYADAVVAGRVSAQTELKVREAKTRFERAFESAISDSRGDTHAPAPPEVKRLAGELLDLLRTATNAVPH